MQTVRVSARIRERINKSELDAQIVYKCLKNESNRISSLAAAARLVAFSSATAENIAAANIAVANVLPAFVAACDAKKVWETTLEAVNSLPLTVEEQEEARMEARMKEELREYMGFCGESSDDESHNNNEDDDIYVN